MSSRGPPPGSVMVEASKWALIIARTMVSSIAEPPVCDRGPVGCLRASTLHRPQGARSASLPTRHSLTLSREAVVQRSPAPAQLKRRAASGQAEAVLILARLGSSPDALGERRTPAGDVSSRGARRLQLGRLGTSPDRVSLLAYGRRPCLERTSRPGRGSLNPSVDQVKVSLVACRPPP